MSLGKWALIDIETTGIDESYDEIIDVGFLSFDGLELDKKYSSLVKSENALSQFIQKLTGITSQMMKGAPLWEQVKVDVLELDEHVLLAHNAAFEDKFLTREFKEIGVTPAYADSLHYLSLLNPGRDKLNLDSFIRQWNIRDAEKHRGFEDSIDLLKVMLLETYKTFQNSSTRYKLLEEFSKYSTDEFWFKNFFKLGESELEKIAGQIDFNLKEHFLSVEIEESYVDVEEIELDLDFSGKSIEKLFKSEEEVKKVLPYYKFRDSQLQLAKRVGQSFSNNIHSLIQAPTGTGKTLGYLVPAALFALSKGEKVLVSTGTKTLQNQAEKKDIPALRKVLGHEGKELRVTKLIGSKNHYCELLFRQKNEEADLLNTIEFDKKFTQSYFELVFFQNSIIEKNSNRINRESIPYSMKMMNASFKETDEDIAVDFRSCSGHKCPFKASCSYYQGLKEARDSDIILGNHALMLNWPKSFARPEYIIVDEAHKLEGEATQAFVKEATGKSLMNVAKQLGQSNSLGSLFYLLSKELEQKATPIIDSIKESTSAHAQTLLDHLSPLETLMEGYFKKSPRYTSIYWNELPMINKAAASDNTSVAIVNHLESIQFVLKSTYEELTPHAARFDLNNFKDEMDISAWSKFETFFAAIEDSLVALNYCLEKMDGYCSSMSFHEKEGYLFRSSPIDVGREIFKNVIEESKSIVMTSATMADGKGESGTVGAEWSTGHLYIDKERRFKTGLYLPAIYDYANKAKVFLVSDVVPMYKSEFVPNILDKVIPLIKAIDGKTLLLFSSKARFEIAREILLKEFEGKLPLFIQGMGQNIVEDFKNSPNGILLGMESLGEGIDIPGEKLQFILIDKIPDIRQEFVIQKRREFFERTFGDEFNQYFLATRARLLQQKLGRLLRSEEDRGAIIVIDGRISNWKARTKKVFHNLLNPYEINEMSFDAAVESCENFIKQV